MVAKRNGQNSLWGTAGCDVYEVRPRKSRDGVHLISDRFRYGPIWYAGPDAVRNAVAYAKYRSLSRSHRANIRVTSSRTLRTTCVSKERKMKIYESHNVSASSSLAWAWRSLGDGGMASTHGVPNQESKIHCAYPIALLIAFGSPYHSPPNGSASEIRSTPRRG